jgi:gliding motility-associated-like protein
MKTGSKNIEQVFKSALDNFEADVNPALWKNIEQGLQPSSGSSVRGKYTHKIFNGRTIISVIAITGAAILAYLYFSSDKSPVASPAEKIKASAETVKPADPVLRPEVKSASEPVHQVVSGKTVMQKPVRTQEQKKTLTLPTTDQHIDLGNDKKAVQTPPLSKAETAAPVVPHLDNKSNVKTPAEVNENNSKSKTENSNANTSSAVEESKYAPDNSPVTDMENGFAFYIPKAFSPNGDGINDSFTPLGHNFKDFDLIIYDRLGFEIFKSKDISVSWDGKLGNGTEAIHDIYFYVINVKDTTNKNHSYKGTISLIR